MKYATFGAEIWINLSDVLLSWSYNSVYHLKMSQIKDSK